MGRPRKPVDSMLVRQLRKNGMSCSRIASALMVSQRTARRAGQNAAKPSLGTIPDAPITLAAGIASDQYLSCGNPCIEGTGIRTDVVAGRFKAGESLAELAQDYGLSESQIEAAIRFELP